MLLAYLLRIFMGSMIFLLLLEELFDSQKFVFIKLSLIIIDFLILCYAFLSILHTPWVSCYTSNILLMKKLKIRQNQLERIEYMLNTKTSESLIFWSFNDVNCSYKRGFR